MTSAGRWRTVVLATVVAGSVLATTGAAVATDPPPGAAILSGPNPPTGPEDTAAVIVPDPLTAGSDSPYKGACIQLLGWTAAKRCDFGDRAASIVIDVVGDSHAEQWLPALQVAATAHHWHVISYTKMSCPFNGRTIELGGQPATRCSTWVGNVLHAVEADHPTLLITSAKPYRVLDRHGTVLSVQDSVPALMGGYRQVWDKLGAAGVPVAVLEDTPLPDFDMVGCVAANRDHLTACARSRKEFFHLGMALHLAAVRDRAVLRLDFNRLVCPWSECAGVIGEVLVWRDNHHLSATYSASAGGAVGDQVASLLGAG